MTTWKHSNCIITNVQPVSAEIQKKMDEQKRKSKSTIKSTHLLTVDGERIKDFFYVDCSWLWKGSTQGTIDEAHIHDFNEVIGFVGSNREDPHDLGGEITIWLDDDKQVLTKGCLIFIPETWVVSLTAPMK